MSGLISLVQNHVFNPSLSVARTVTFQANTGTSLPSVQSSLLMLLMLSIVFCAWRIRRKTWAKPRFACANSCTQSFEVFDMVVGALSTRLPYPKLTHVINRWNIMKPIFDLNWYLVCTAIDFEVRWEFGMILWTSKNIYHDYLNLSIQAQDFCCEQQLSFSKRPLVGHGRVPRPSFGSMSVSSDFDQWHMIAECVIVALPRNFVMLHVLSL